VFGYESYQVGWRDLGLGGGLITPPLAVQWSVFAPAIQRGEWWRFLTAGFVHFDVLHIGLNIVALLYAGAFVEPRYGKTRMLAIYLLALLFGNALAYATTATSRTVTGGASGAIMGLFGAIGVFAFRFWSQRNQLQYAVGPVVATLLNGFLHSNISNAAHIGGLIGGAIGAVVVGALPSLVTAIREGEQAAVRVAQAADSAGPPSEVPESVEQDPANRLVLSPSPVRRAIFVVTGLLFLGGGVALVLAQQYVWGILCAFVGGIAAFGAWRQRLVLSPRGFMVTSLLGHRFVRWRDVERFGLVPYGGATLVGFALTPSIVAEADQRASLLGKLVVEREGRLPTGFRMKPQTQVALMEEWRTRWTRPAAGRDQAVDASGRAMTSSITS
jgi:membrane associated rhomboid family serine protease